MNLNKFYLSIYKTLGFAVLMSMVLGIIGYAVVIAFYSLNRNWATPMTISPTQEKVLMYQPQIATLESTYIKQKNELATSKEASKLLEAQISDIDVLIKRIDNAAISEASQAAKSGELLGKIAQSKRQDIARSASNANDIRKLLSQTDSELAAKLITSDQAALRKASLQQALNSVTDSSAQLATIQFEANRQLNASSTLTGGSSSLGAISTIKQETELKTMKAQLKLQLDSNASNTKALEESVTETARVLDVAKQSLYYKALRENVTVAFVPYDNLSEIKTGSIVYDCYLQILACHKVGTVKQTYSAEEYVRHPVFKTDLKGKLVELTLDNASYAESKVVFIGRKPLFL